MCMRTWVLLSRAFLLSVSLVSSDRRLIDSNRESSVSGSLCLLAVAHGPFVAPHRGQRKNESWGTLGRKWRLFAGQKA